MPMSVACGGLLWLQLICQATPSADRPEPFVVSASLHRGGNAQAVAISPDGKLVAAAYGGPSNGFFPLKPNGGGIAVWETATGKQVRFHGEYGDILKLEFSADGKSLAYARVYTPGDSVDDHVVVVLDLGSGEVRQRWRASDVGSQFLCSRSANHIIFGNVVYDLKDFSPVKTLAVSGVRCLATDPGGQRLAAVHYVKSPVIRPDGSVDPNVHHLLMKGLSVFNAVDYTKLCGSESEDLTDCFTITLSPNGRHVVTGHSEGTAMIWRVDVDALQETMTFVTGYSGHLLPAFTPDGQMLLLASQPAEGLRWNYQREQPKGFNVEQRGLGPSSDISAWETRHWTKARQWRLEDAAFRTIFARVGNSQLVPEASPVRLVCSPDGQSVLAACNGVSLLDLETGKTLRQFTTDDISP